MDRKISKGRGAVVAYWLAATTLAVALFYIGYIAGNIHGTRSVVPPGEARVTNQGDVSQAENINFKQFWEVWNLIKDNYVYQPVSEQDLFYGALQGMLQGLNDSYSVFLTPEMAAEFNQELEGKFFGIGAEIGEKDDFIVIVAPLADSPAERAGLAAGDKIIGINGEDTYGMTLNEAVYQIRGEEGTEVVLTVVKNGLDSVEDITIVRGEITIDSVAWEIRDDGIAVINLYMFNEDTTPLFQEAVQEILTQDVDGIVLDLRNNPGGLLTEAINVAGYWINGETVVFERVQGEDRPFASAGIAHLAGIPTTVLVNGGSASGSEILAGALQDYGVATIIGETTFGKGSVQEYYGFPDESAMKVTVAEWLTPKGRSINQTGIEPDIVVEYTKEDLDAEKTPQFDAAIDFLKTSQ